MKEKKRIKDLYENFFEIVLPRTDQRFGIVYAPNEIVDFILKSANWAIRNELNIPECLSADNVEILDPFTGTGTFIVRLIQLGLNSPEKLEYKYKNELHAQKILLVAYYIFHIIFLLSILKWLIILKKTDKNYEPFPGIILTYTFTTRKEITDQIGIFLQNDKRVDKINQKDITVIIGNSPYSVGQKKCK